MTKQIKILIVIAVLYISFIAWFSIVPYLLFESIGSEFECLDDDCGLKDRILAEWNDTPLLEESGNVADVLHTLPDEVSTALVKKLGWYGELKHAQKMINLLCIIRLLSTLLTILIGLMLYRYRDALSSLSYSRAA